VEFPEVWLQVRPASLKCCLNGRGHACTHTAFKVTVHC
jgi:hypothetical protein